jgi:hypothetical protein
MLLSAGLIASSNIMTGGTDPYINNVVLFLKGDGTNGSTAVVDSSPTPKTINRINNPVISTAQSKYGGSSIYFDGSSRLEIPGSFLSSASWTVET